MRKGLGIFFRELRKTGSHPGLNRGPLTLAVSALPPELWPPGDSQPSQFSISLRMCHQNPARDRPVTPLHQGRSHTEHVHTKWYTINSHCWPDWDWLPSLATAVPVVWIPYCWPPSEESSPTTAVGHIQLSSKQEYMACSLSKCVVLYTTLYISVVYYSLLAKCILP